MDFIHINFVSGNYDTNMVNVAKPKISSENYSHKKTKKIIFLWISFKAHEITLDLNRTGCVKILYT